MKKIWIALLICFLFSSVVSVEAFEEYTSGDYTYKLLEDGSAEITDYNGEEGVVEFPEELDGHTVTSISIEYAVSLTDVTVPNTVKKIDDWGFLNCINLTSITLPDSIETMGFNPFEGCKIYTINISPDHPYLALINGVLYSKPDKRLIFCPDTINKYSVPNGIQIIDHYAFIKCKHLANLTLPDTLISIGRNAFEDCHDLTSVNFPEGLTEIGRWAFAHCYSLESLILPDTLTTIPEWAFVGCSSVESIKFPNALTEIGTCAFQYCDGLTDITLPESLMLIDEAAFYGCEGLTNVTLSDGLKIIEDEAFYECGNLTSINIPSSVTSIGEEAFAECENLTVTVSPGSFAEDYCIENGINYVYSDTDEGDASSEVYDWLMD